MYRAMFGWTFAAVMLGCGASSSVANNASGGTQDGNTFIGSQNSNTVTDASLACPEDANDTFAPARKACVDRINAYRATLGLVALTRWCGTAACIDTQTQNDSTLNTSHSAFGNCNENAQNECPGWSLPVQDSILACLSQMWAEGPGTDYAAHGHYINMTSEKYTQVECGLSVNGNSFWAAMDFH